MTNTIIDKSGKCWELYEVKPKQSKIKTYTIELVTSDGCYHSHRWRSSSIENLLSRAHLLYGPDFDLCFIKEH